MIPNTLWQSWKTKHVPESVRSQADSWNMSNPQLEKRFMDDAECSSFVLEHFGEEIYRKYLSLPQPIMRADFWRIAVVYIYGGYYSDLDITCNKSVTQFVNQSVNLVVTREVNNIANYFFGAAPKHPVLKLTLDYMIAEMQHINVKETQSFGMHSLHQAVRDYFKVTETNYISTNEVQFLLDADLRNTNTLIHSIASLQYHSDYESWRARDQLMMEEREQSEPILFFTTFNENGYNLYGKQWIETFIAVSNYYNKFRAKIYYEGFIPKITHPSIEWIDFNSAIPSHIDWKEEYFSKTQHSDYVKTMTVRFSHKAFVIQHVLETHANKNLIWLDGDCVFKNADYSNFPSNILQDKFLACQIEHNRDLNHVESGILIFNGTHSDKMKFVNEFKLWYKVDNILGMGQPYDGFLIFKTLLTTGLTYIDLNEHHGKGGIQSDPSMTFCHPAIKSKFIHNIGWTGKTQYSTWNDIFNRDDIYKKMKMMLFNVGHDPELNKKKASAINTLAKLKMLKG
jgi:mannosyltransferase OCH1-like enzyme